MKFVIFLSPFSVRYRLHREYLIKCASEMKAGNTRDMTRQIHPRARLMYRQFLLVLAVAVLEILQTMYGTDRLLN